MEPTLSFSSKSFNGQSFSYSKSPFHVIQTIAKCEKLSDSIFCYFSPCWYSVTLYIEDRQLFYRKDSDKTGKNIDLVEFHIIIPNGGYGGKEYVFALFPLKDNSLFGASGWHISLPDEDSLLVATSIIQNILDRQKFREPRFICGFTLKDFGDTEEKANYSSIRTDNVITSLNDNSLCANFSRNNSSEMREEISQENFTNHFPITESTNTNSVNSIGKCVIEFSEHQQLNDSLFMVIHRKLCKVPIYKQLNDLSETNSKRRLLQWLFSLMICSIVFASSSIEHILYQTNVILMFYPVYGSMFAVEQKMGTELRHWLIFWVIFGLFLLFDTLPFLFFPLSLYVFIKINLLVDCMAGDAKRIYDELLKPFVVVLERMWSPKQIVDTNNEVSKLEINMKDISIPTS